MDLLTILIILGIAQGIFLGISLLTLNRGNQKANRVMGSLMILFSVSISHIVFYNLNLFQKFPHFHMISHPPVYLFGPLFLLYVLYYTKPDFELRPIHLFHGLPFVAYVLYLLPFYLLSGEEKLVHMAQYVEQVTVIDYLVTPSQIVLLFVYLYFVNRLVREHEARIKKAYSSIEGINLSWIKMLIKMLVAVFAFMAVLVVFMFTGLQDFVYSYGLEIMALMVAVAMYIAGYYSLQQPDVFAGGEIAAIKQQPEKSGLDGKRSDRLLEKLTAFMEEEKPYRNSDLTIKELAERAGIPGYILSQLINEELDQNFFDFVNRYRIDEAKEKLSDPHNANLTILSIAFDVGFNSKSVFNTAFKKYEDTTPSQYRKLTMSLN
jgi:AraC-like DNA-binding protein